MAGGSHNLYPKNATFVTSTAESELTAEVNLGALTTGVLKHAVAGGISTPATATADTDYYYPSSTDSITAFATGGQANATALTTHMNRITTCATAGDSVKLPSTFVVDYRVVVANDGDARADLFPASGDTIDGLAADTAIQILPSQRVTLVGTTADSAWRTI